MKDLPENQAIQRRAVTADRASIFTQFSNQPPFDWSSGDYITPAHTDSGS